MAKCTPSEAGKDLANHRWTMSKARKKVMKRELIKGQLNKYKSKNAVEAVRRMQEKSKISKLKDTAGKYIRNKRNIVSPHEARMSETTYPAFPHDNENQKIVSRKFRNMKRRQRRIRKRDQQ